MGNTVTPWAYTQAVGAAMWTDESIRVAHHVRSVEVFAPRLAAEQGYRLAGRYVETVQWLYEQYEDDATGQPVVVVSRPVKTPEEATIGMWRIEWPDAERIV